MRIVFIGNNWTGWKLLEVLKQYGDEIVALIVHPSSRQKYREQIVAAAGLAADHVFDGAQLADANVMSKIGALLPDMAVVGCFGYILRKPVLELFPRGCVNCHTSLLPYNRGAFPNVWSILDRTPAGVSLHYIDEGVDTGDVIAQTEVPAEPVDTGETLYRKLEVAAVQLFRETWPKIRSGAAPRVPQKPGIGSCHKVVDVAAIDRIDLDRTYKARELIDLLRARTFPPYRGAYFVENGKSVYMRLSLEYGDE